MTSLPIGFGSNTDKEEVNLGNVVREVRKTENIVFLTTIIYAEGPPMPKAVGDL